jgi:hypothetical protein
MEEQERGNCFKSREEGRRRGMSVKWTNEKSGKAKGERRQRDGRKENKLL